MKKLLLIACTAILSFGCNDKSGSSSAGSDSTKPAETKTGDIVYPYTLDGPYRDWQPGDQKHAVTVMSSLKGFETGNMTACMAGFADSVEIYFDNFQKKMSRDSLTKFFTDQRAMSSSIKIKMYDWESVIAKDKKDEWVTLWYKEVQTNNKGITDSVSVTDDVKIVNGKIALLDEKTRHYASPKK